MYNIRLANENDFKRIHELLIDIAKFHNEGRPDIFKPNSSKYEEQKVIELIKNEDDIIFVATNEKNYVVGYCICQIIMTEENSVLYGKKALFIDDFCIDENFRSSGIGKLMFEFIKKYSKDILKIPHIELNVWGFNENAIKFYEKNGFSTKKKVMELDL